MTDEIPRDVWAASASERAAEDLGRALLLERWREHQQKALGRLGSLEEVRRSLKGEGRPAEFMVGEFVHEGAHYVMMTEFKADWGDKIWTQFYRLDEVNSPLLLEALARMREQDGVPAG